MAVERKGDPHTKILDEVRDLVNGKDFPWVLPSWGKGPPPEEMISRGSDRFRNTVVALGLVAVFATSLLFGDHRQLSPNIQPKPQPFIAKIAYQVKENIPPSRLPAGCSISYRNYEGYLMSCGG